MLSQGGDMPRSTKVCRRPAPQKRQVGRFAEVFVCTLTCPDGFPSFEHVIRHANQRVLGDNLSAVRRTRSQLKHLPSYRMLRGMIVGEAVVALATPEYLAERVIQNGHPGQNASAFVVVKKISNEHPQPCRDDLRLTLSVWHLERKLKMVGFTLEPGESPDPVSSEPIH
jgi:hypothetical protein